ncbi:MAG: transglutaminase-like domain-containing protein [Opitutales bacterium]|nr:transglutaminase-like domain-containing protein [Opitutales bacterium]
MNSSEKTNFNSIKALIDDETPLVRKAVIQQLKDFPDQGKTFLKDILDGADRLLAKHAQEINKSLGWADVVGDFLNFIRSQRYELETGWFLLDRTVYPNFQATSATLFLDRLADRVRDLVTPPLSPRQTCALLNRVLFHEYGFRGSGKNFENPQNSFLHRVLDRRQGLPITLSVIYLLIARRIGLELDPIGLPGRFMVGCFAEEKPFYVDAWSGGKILELDQMENFLEHSSIEDSGSALLPVTVSETLCRGCRNLVYHFELSKDSEKSNLFSSFVKEFERVQRLASNA